MLSWIEGNIATIVIAALLIAVVAGIVRYMVKNKKKGNNSCGCGCGDCPMSGSCHKGLS